MTANPSGANDASAVADLESVLATTEKIIGGVSRRQEKLATPCPDFDVSQLIDHLVGWAATYAARLSGREPATEPNSHRAGASPAQEFQSSAAEIVAGYRRGGEAAEQLPIGILLMEFEAHGWDLAMATSQPAAFRDEEVERALAVGRQMLKPEYRGPDKQFGREVEPPAGATTLQTLVAFLGRDPRWVPAQHA